MMNMRRLSLPSMDFSALKNRIDWVKAGKVVTFGLLAAAAVMIIFYARNIDWNAVARALKSYSAREIAFAGALTACSFLTYSCFDLFGRHYTGYELRTARVMLITAISYAFNLTLGSIVGAAGMRLRLYQQIGVKAGDVGRIILISVGINWLGYALVAGVLFVAGLIQLPPDWEVNARTLPILGWALIAVVASYIGASIFYGDRGFTVRGREVCLPKTGAAVLQLVLASCNWMIMGGVLYCLMQQKVTYALTLAVVMVSSVAGIISRIPGGIGVLEAVSIAILAPQLTEARVLAGVLAYRAIYYLAPLVLATGGFLALQAADRGQAASAAE
ncbi:lysylphosphatidylglycerol synthase domain-containing protein [Uliginosibacterium sp. H3]|uniref:Lysylphosphatidylglycerol synthase domain-containing protein n=1 Tax=Uliginosibacterium silvisoli TaxID=3114758 RepID=A0ABU6K7Q2_9RHOO|nr:lysylphosphatidylglycerol synthase domain-containing protein [Uliginosibacterium sp. H3]